LLGGWFGFRFHLRALFGISIVIGKGGDVILRRVPSVILAATIALELGQIDRFASAAHLASYAGTTPRVHASGDKTRFGALRTDINQYLKWAFAEAGNSVALYHQRRPQRHVSQLYRRVRLRKGMAKPLAPSPATWPRRGSTCGVSGKRIASRQEVDPRQCKRDSLMSRPRRTRRLNATHCWNKSMPQ
jgi:Transposase IS116/IS110/IS902 family